MLAQEAVLTAWWPVPSLRTLRTVAIRALAVFTLFMLLGNAAILVASALAAQTTAAPAVGEVRGVHNLEAVDRRVWRGSAPTREGYRQLAALGVRTVVDLRAEDDLRDDRAFLATLGVELVRIPIRDGQTPGAEKVERFLTAIDRSKGITFLHCGAGVGRTGSMAAAYLVRSGEDDPVGALRRNLAVGPPSLEQISYVAGLGSGDLDRPGPVLRAVSRTLDAPRRIWSRIG